MEENCRECELEATNIQFRPYGTAQNLPVIGKAKMKLKVGNGAEIETDCYINNDDKEESLLGESDTIRLGIIEINTQGPRKRSRLIGYGRTRSRSWSGTGSSSQRPTNRGSIRPWTR